jgi:hypothetical protein
MNGRVYDPYIGRFLSPDPLVQQPGNLQNYNRYSYVLNNPLKYTDPSGYSYGHGFNRDRLEEAHGGGGTWINPDMFNSPQRDFNVGYEAMPGVYNYSEYTGNYTNSNGNTVGYQEVFNNYVLPNAEITYRMVKTETEEYEIASAYFNPSEGEYGVDQLTLHIELKKVIKTEYSLVPCGEITDWVYAVEVTLTLEDLYNNFGYNHTKYNTTKGVLKNIYKSNGAVRSARAARFAKLSTTLKVLGNIGTGLMVASSSYHILSGNGTGFDWTDASVGAIGLINAGAMQWTTYGIPAIGQAVAIYAASRAFYEETLNMTNYYMQNNINPGMQVIYFKE